MVQEMTNCNHENVTCINPYEIIRKYKCNLCGEVMMCSCEEEFGRKYLPHQLDQGTEYQTQKRVSVTIGFQPKICNTCRKQAEEAYPKAETYGRSSKIHRYYWREILIETTIRFGNWAEKNGYGNWLIAQGKHPDVYKKIEKSVVEEIKVLHEKCPKYQYKEESENEIITKYNIEVVTLHALYSKVDTGKAKIIENGVCFSVEDFAANHFVQMGYEVIFTESIPFHVIFAVLTWLVIQDSTDPHCQVVGFGSRTDFESGVKTNTIWTLLPSDFGTKGYYERRSKEIKAHLQYLSINKSDLLWFFDYWLEPSSNLRQYLWAHEIEKIEIAKRIIEILPSETIIQIINYLIQDYWGRYCGWPDLLAYKDNEFLFIEVKSSNDKLSEDQKKWIIGNHDILHLPFKIVKVHKKNEQKKHYYNV